MCSNSTINYFINLICGVVLIVIPAWVHAQLDTIVKDISYQIVKRYSNGNAKYIGNYQFNYNGEEEKKHGEFIKLKRNGVIIKTEMFFYGNRRNKKILGVKIGAWGFYGLNTMYFIGIRRGECIVHPCF
jgi:hypothetical protein